MTNWNYTIEPARMSAFIHTFALINVIWSHNLSYFFLFLTHKHRDATLKGQSSQKAPTSTNSYTNTAHICCASIGMACKRRRSKGKVSKQTSTGLNTTTNTMHTVFLKQDYNTIKPWAPWRLSLVESNNPASTTQCDMRRTSIGRHYNRDDQQETEQKKE